MIRGGTTVSGTAFTTAGWQNGVFASSSQANLSAENVTVHGVRELGILLGQNGSRATHCSVQVVGHIGISTSGKGMEVSLANNCRGVSSSGVGLYADISSNSIGISTTGTFGLQVTGTASFCRGTRPSGRALSAGIAVGCTSSGGTITATLSKQLGTP